MAFPEINPRFIETLQRTAGARIAQEVAQRLSPTSVQRIQQILRISDFAEGVFGNSGAQPQPLLGGVSMDFARDLHDQLQNARLARKNLFFIQVTDPNPPDLKYVSRPAGASSEASRIGEVIDTGRRILSGGLGGVISDGLRSLGGTAGRGAGGGSSAAQMFNLFATSVSYSPVTMVGEKVPFGSATLDRLNGTEATELQITTMDDEVGTLKRWFEGKSAQAAHPDGTFGVPMEYLVNIAIYHAVVRPDDRAFKFHAKMRTQSIQMELSRSEQAMQEISMTFSQFDSFVTVPS